MEFGVIQIRYEPEGFSPRFVCMGFWGLGLKIWGLGFWVLGFGIWGFVRLNGWKTKISVTHQPSVCFETSFGLTPDQGRLGHTKLQKEILQSVP